MLPPRASAGCRSAAAIDERWYAIDVCPDATKARLSRMPGDTSVQNTCASSLRPSTAAAPVSATRFPEPIAPTAAQDGASANGGAARR